MKMEKKIPERSRSVLGRFYCIKYFTYYRVYLVISFVVGGCEFCKFKLPSWHAVWTCLCKASVPAQQVQYLGCLWGVGMCSPSPCLSLTGRQI